MTDSFAVLSETLVRVLGHSLWQALVVGGLAWCLLRLLPARRAELRYGIAVGGLGIIVLMTFATWSILRLVADQPVETSAILEVIPDRSQTDRDLVIPTAVTSSQNTKGLIRVDQRIAVQCLSAAWLCGAVVMLVRGLTGFMTVRKWLAESAVSVGPDVSRLEEIVCELSQRFGLRRIARVVVSERLSVPAVIGTLWPVIFVPPALLSGVPVEQWRIILAHELAHVRRWDALVSMVQMVVESLLFFNPVVWWLSHQICVEREACCDALAVDVCGQPLSVARALVDVASTVNPLEDRGRKSLTQRAVMAFAEPTKEGELTDRVRRLVEPDQAPRPHVSWLGVGIVLFVLLLGVVLLQRGTDMAVRAAAEWMSPKERIEKLVQLEVERNGNFVPAAMNSKAENESVATSTSLDSPTQADPGKIAVVLIVKTDDGADIDQKLQIHSLASTGRHSSGNSIGSPKTSGPEYRMTLYYPPCKLRVGASYPGRATVISPVISLMPDAGEKTIELVLTKGTAIEVAVRNEQGQSIPNAWIQQGASTRLQGSTSGWSGSEQQTNAQGRLRFEHIGKVDYSLAIQAPGYQRQNLLTDFSEPEALTAEAPFVITLKAAHPTPVRVLDATTNEPIKAARVRIAHRQSQSHSSSYSFNRQHDTPNRWNDYAVTGDDGCAQLDQLVDDTTYTFAVLAPGYGTSVLTTKAGRSEQVVKLHPPFTISGQVTGSLERLGKPADSKRSGYQFGVSSSLSAHMQSHSVWAEVDTEGRFKVEGLSMGEKVNFSLPDIAHSIVIRESINDIKLVIPPATGPEDGVQRDVIIRLTRTAEDAPARGTLQVHWSHASQRMKDDDYQPRAVRNNEVRLKIPVGAKLNFSERDLVGYRVDERSDIDIKDGSEALVIDVPTTATGGIHGSITRADGSPATQAFASAFATKLPRSEKDHRRINPSSMSGSGQFLRKVPLGGRYVILAREQTAQGTVWAISEEVTIDEEHPIATVDLKLPVGRDWPLKVVDESGRAVVGQRVELEVAFRLKSVADSGFSFGIENETDAAGIANFRGLALLEPLGPIDLKLHVVAQPGPLQGTTMPVDPRKPTELRLKHGLSVKGVLISAATQKPLADTELRILPRDFSKAVFKNSVKTQTDANGNFEFRGLEAIEYHVVSPHSVKPLQLDPRSKTAARLEIAVPE